MADQKGSLKLSTVFGGILKALREAKQLGDRESAKLLETYKEEKLFSFSVPAFNISDIEIELRFVITGNTEEGGEGKEIPNLEVTLSPTALKGLEAHHISVMKVKISPVTIRVLEEG